MRLTYKPLLTNKVQIGNDDPSTKMTGHHSWFGGIPSHLRTSSNHRWSWPPPAGGASRRRQLGLRLTARRRPHLFVFHHCGAFNYAFVSKVALITAVQLRSRRNVNGTLSTRAELIGWQRAQRRSASFPDDSNNKPEPKCLKGTNEQTEAGIIV